MEGSILQINGLTVQFERKKCALTVVDNLWLEIGANEILGIVGESGSGKTQTMLAAMRLTQPPGKVSAGSVLFHGQDLLRMSRRQIYSVRGKRIAMIFQDPMAALDPVFTCGYQMMETLRRHERLPRAQAHERCEEMLKAVGLREPEKVMRSYPFELSGGMCQRVMIAIALLCSPEVLIADEPTTALDVTVQAQILELLLKLREERKMSIVLITHDLAVVSDVTDRVAILYAGRLMEVAPTQRLIDAPIHPYTQGLLKSVVCLDMDAQKDLSVIPGTVPDLPDIPKGCAFATRCPRATSRCIIERPQRSEYAPGHFVYCFCMSKGGSTLE